MLSVGGGNSCLWRNVCNDHANPAFENLLCFIFFYRFHSHADIDLANDMISTFTFTHFV